jgi:receptor expression-enhancing protein 5/6
MMVIEFGSCLIADVCGFIYPAYMSFKSLETKELDDDKIWLTYWVIYAILNIYRITLGTVLKIIPFYDIIRLIFYIYLFHPKTQGAVVIYDLIIKPIITKYEND